MTTVERQQDRSVVDEPPAAVDRRPGPVLQERHATVAGRRMRYLIGGEGPPLVLVHGFMSSAEAFGPWLTELARIRTLVVPDLPGASRSEALTTRHSSAALAAALDGLLDILDLHRFDLGAVCLGVPVAAELMRRRPGAVDRLVLHTPLLEGGMVQTRFRLQVRLLLSPPLFPLVVRLARSRRVSDLYKRFLVENGAVAIEGGDRSFRNQCDCDADAQREWIFDTLDCSDADLLAARDAPTLMVICDDDRLVDTTALRQMVATWPAVSLLVDTEGGHNWTEDSAARQVGAIVDFLGG